MENDHRKFVSFPLIKMVDSFHSYATNYQGLNPLINPFKPPFSYGFLVFLWFSYGFPMLFWFSYGFLVFLWFSHGFPLTSPGELLNLSAAWKKNGSVIFASTDAGEEKYVAVWTIDKNGHLVGGLEDFR